MYNESLSYGVCRGGGREGEYGGRFLSLRCEGDSEEASRTQARMLSSHQLLQAGQTASDITINPWNMVMKIKLTTSHYLCLIN